MHVNVAVDATRKDGRSVQRGIAGRRLALECAEDRHDQITGRIAWDLAGTVQGNWFYWSGGMSCPHFARPDSNGICPASGTGGPPAALVAVQTALEESQSEAGLTPGDAAFGHETTPITSEFLDFSAIPYPYGYAPSNGFSEGQALERAFALGGPFDFVSTTSLQTHINRSFASIPGADSQSQVYCFEQFLWPPYSGGDAPTASPNQPGVFLLAYGKTLVGGKEVDALTVEFKHWTGQATPLCPLPEKCGCHYDSTDLENLAVVPIEDRSKYEPNWVFGGAAVTYVR